SADADKYLGPVWLSLAENVGRGWDVDGLHNAFMKSAAHRANILDATWDYIGIGVVVDGRGEMWVTINFVDTTVPVPTVEQPPVGVAGDFDGDGKTDVLHYGPGPGQDRIHWGGNNGTFTTATLTVNGVYTPVVGDFDGDGKDDIFWYAPGPAADSMWF